MKKLMSMLKVIPDNVRVLHRNLIGAGWFADHKELGKIYDALDEVADDVMEIAMSLGHAEPSLAEAVSEYESIGGSAYENEQAWSMLHAMLLDLHEEIGNHEGSVPGDVWNKLEEHQYYLNKLANYKVASRLNKRAEELEQEVNSPVVNEAGSPIQKKLISAELKARGLDGKSNYPVIKKIGKQMVSAGKKDPSEMLQVLADVTPGSKYSDKEFSVSKQDRDKAEELTQAAGFNFMETRQLGDAEVFSTEELQEAFRAAGYDTGKYTTEYLAEQLGFVPVREGAGDASEIARIYQSAKKDGKLDKAGEDRMKLQMHRVLRHDKLHGAGPMPIPGGKPESDEKDK